MRLMNCLTIWGAIFLIISCSNSQDTVIDKYFSIPQFIDDQVSVLVEKENQLQKTVSFGNSTESISVSNLNADQLKKELRIFKEHDINKPVLIDAYHTQEENTGGARITSYELIDSVSSGIQDMEIIFDSLNQVSSWESSFKEENLLYCNFRKLKLSTDKAGILQSYQIKGYHKLMFKDTVYYQLQVDITY